MLLQLGLRRLVGEVAPSKMEMSPLAHTIPFFIERSFESLLLRTP